MKYYPPKFGEKQFHCAICSVFASQTFGGLELAGSTVKSNMYYSRCSHCSKLSYWHESRMLFPAMSSAPLAHPDLPVVCKSEYDEARDVLNRSPRAAAALMRLCIQKLMPALGQPGKNINDDIAALVKAGLPAEVQQALDYCRVVGNNAVHPGEMSTVDDPAIAATLFEMVNFVVEDRISRPNRIAGLYATLPAGAVAAVQKRDGVT